MQGKRGTTVTECAGGCVVGAVVSNTKHQPGCRVVLKEYRIYQLLFDQWLSAVSIPTTTAAGHTNNTQTNLMCRRKTANEACCVRKVRLWQV